MRCTQILTREKSVYLRWKEMLCPLTIQTDFDRKYRLVHKIGKGSFANVYLVERISDHKRFAVKFFSKQSLIR